MSDKSKFVEMSIEYENANLIYNNPIQKISIFNKRNVLQYLKYFIDIDLPLFYH